MNSKLIIGLILLLVIATPLIVTSQYQGTPKAIVWTGYFDRNIAIMDLAKGTIDAFIFVTPAREFFLIPAEMLAKLRLFRAVSSYNDLAFNVIYNVIDPDKPGKVYRWEGDEGVPGKLIPGIVYAGVDYINITDITDYTYLHFNPLSLKKFRQAFYYLIDRASIVETIYKGGAEIRYTVLSKASHHPYDYELLKPIEDAYGFSPTGDKAKAAALAYEAISEVNATLLAYGMMVYYGSDGFLYFKKPDGSVEQVKINFVIRADDVTERLPIGLSIADDIETYLKVKVVRATMDRIPAIFTVYYYEQHIAHDWTAYGGYVGDVWHIYTEGWVLTADLTYYDAAGDIAFFYLYGDVVAGGNNEYWGEGYYNYYSHNPDMRKWYNELVYEKYPPARRGVLEGRMKTYFKYGVDEAIRVWIVDIVTYFAVNRDSIISAVPGRVTGLNNPISMWSVVATKETVTYGQWAGVATVFMSPWNPVLGFRDVYTEYVRRHLRSYGSWRHPYTGVSTPIHVASWKVERAELGYRVGDIDAYVFDPVASKWIKITDVPTEAPHLITIMWNMFGGYNFDTVNFLDYRVPVKITVVYRSIDYNGRKILGFWHDGTPITMNDILYAIAFSYEWSFPDHVVTGQPDPYFHGWLLGGLSSLALNFGWRVVNETAIEVYLDWDWPIEEIVAASGVVWPDMPWYMYLAGEELIARGVVGPNGRYDWRHTTGRTAVDYIGSYYQDKKTVYDIRDMLITLRTEFSEGEFIEPYSRITTYPGFENAIDDFATTLVPNALNFTNTYDHAYISSGPFYISRYDIGIVENFMTIREWPYFKQIFPLDRIIDELKLTYYGVYAVESLKPVKEPVYIVYGEPLRLEVKIAFAQLIPKLAFEPLDPAKVSVRVIFWNTDVTPDATINVYPDGTITIEIPAAVIQQIIPTGSTPYPVTIIVYHADAAEPLVISAIVEIESTAVPPPVPEPAILPLIILALILLALLIIKRK
ncbi:MAG: hypothetical protein QXP72_05760 [Desulfurococcaceae archaeon]